METKNVRPQGADLPFMRWDGCGAGFDHLYLGHGLRSRMDRLDMLGGDADVVLSHKQELLRLEEVLDPVLGPVREFTTDQVQCHGPVA